MDALEAFNASKKLNMKMKPRTPDSAQGDTAQSSTVQPHTADKSEPTPQNTPQTQNATSTDGQNGLIQDGLTQGNLAQGNVANATKDDVVQGELTDKPPTQTAQVQQKLITPTSETAPKPKSDVVPVNISIAGTHHRIVCPAGEVRHLETAATYINDKVRSIRQDIKGKAPTTEELLVLTCLEMYDQLKALQDDEDYYTTERDEALALIDKMLKTTKATNQPR